MPVDSAAAPRLLFLSLFSALILAACGGGTSEPQASAAATQATPQNAQSAVTATGGAVSPQSRSGSVDLDTDVLRVAAQASRTSEAATTASTAGLLRGTGYVALTDNLAQPAAPSGAQRITGRGWYVDATNGNDSNPGTQEAPWRTLTPARTTSFGAGDALLLKCGEVFRDSLELSNRNVPQGNMLVTGYGDCSGNRRPVMRGSDWLEPSGWRKSSNGSQPIYSRTVTGRMQQLFLDGAPLMLARFPNHRGVGAEFALSAPGLAASAQRFKVGSAELAQLADKDLVGATVYVRNSAWAVAKARIISFDAGNGIVTMDRSLPQPIEPGVGYILEGKPWMLDAPGEWHYDEASKLLQLWAPGGVDPSTLNGLEAARRHRGIDARWIKNLRIERLNFEQQTDSGIALLETPHATISDVRVVHAQNIGVYALTCNGLIVQDSNIEGAGYSAILARDSDQTKILRNRVTDTGAFLRSDTTEAAVSVFGAAALVQGNQVDRSASFGIRFANRPGVQVIENSVFQPCQRFTDCAGIYTFTGGTVASQPTGFVQAGVIRDNIVVDAKSNTEGCAPSCENLATGIFLDEMTAGAVVMNNTVSNTEAGIQLHNASFNRITSNRVFGSSATAIRGSLTQNVRGIFRGNVIAGNLLFSHRSSVLQTGGLPAVSDNSTAMHWHHTVSPLMLFTGPAPNTVSGNHYLSVLPSLHATWRLSSNKSQNLLSDGAWSAFAPSDAVANPLTYAPYRLETSESLVANGNFDPRHAKSWSSYVNPNGAGGSISLGNLNTCAQGCARLQTGTTSDYLSSAPFSLDATIGKNLYLLKYRATGGVNGGVRKAMVRRNTSPWENFGLNLPALSLAPGQTDATEAFFRATATSNDAVVDIRSAPKLETLVSELSLVRVTKFEPLQFGRLVTQAVNLDKSTRVINCSDLGLRTCNLVDESGRDVAFPLSIPARSAFPLFVADPSLVYATAAI